MRSLVKTALPISRAKALASNHLRTGGVVKCDTAGENYAFEKAKAPAVVSLNLDPQRCQGIA
jgi:hypothetical protein